MGKLSASEASERERLIVQFLSSQGDTPLARLHKELRNSNPKKFGGNITSSFEFIQRRKDLFSIRHERGHGFCGRIRVVSLVEENKVIEPAKSNADGTVQALVAEISGEFADNLSLEDIGLPPARTGSETRRSAEAIRRITDRLEPVLSARLPKFVQASSVTAQQERIDELLAENAKLKVQLLGEKRHRALAEVDRDRFRDELRSKVLDSVPSVSLDDIDHAMAHSSIKLRTPSCATIK